MTSFISLFKKILFGFIALVIGLEVVYRHQVFDHFFYLFNRYNKNNELMPNKKNILIFGDSHSQNKGSYAFQLREHLKNYNIINLSLAGSGLHQTKLFFNHYSKIYNPEYIIMQFYVGDDLFDIKYEQSEKLSPLKNLYFKLFNSGLSVLWHLNANLIRQTIHSISFDNVLRDIHNRDENKVTKTKNSVNETQKDSYKSILTKREKERINLNPNYIDQQINISSSHYRNAFKDYTSILQNIISPEVKRGTKFIMLFIPHKVQVHKRYLQSYENEGARFKNSPMSVFDYPFYYRTKNEILKKHRDNISFINPIEKLFNMANKGESVYRTDTHLNEKGYGIISKILAKNVSINFKSK